MGAEARNLGEELFKLVDKDESGKISEAEYTAACGIITQVSPELLPADFAKLDENRDGEVDRAEWSRWMGAVMDSRGSATFVAECFRAFRSLTDDRREIVPAIRRAEERARARGARGAMQVACAEADLGVVEWLLELGADPVDGCTAAMHSRRWDVIRLLVSRGRE